MDTLEKWNCKEHKYESYNVPDEWYVTLSERNMNKIINCAECGKKIKFGDGYASKLIHNEIGFGYCVCEECQNKEYKEYAKYREV